VNGKLYRFCTSPERDVCTLLFKFMSVTKFGEGWTTCLAGSTVTATCTVPYIKGLDLLNLVSRVSQGAQAYVLHQGPPCDLSCGSLRRHATHSAICSVTVLVRLVVCSHHFRCREHLYKLFLSVCLCHWRVTHLVLCVLPSTCSESFHWRVKNVKLSLCLIT
jgi:hypothetical protein